MSQKTRLLEHSVQLPVGRMIAIMFSSFSLIASLAIGYATYQEKFTTIVQKVEKQEAINEQLREEISRLNISVARLQGALERNTEAIKNAHIR